MKEIQYLQNYYSIKTDGKKIYLDVERKLPDDETMIFQSLNNLKRYKKCAIDVLMNPSKKYKRVVAIDIETSSKNPFQGEIKLVAVYSQDGVLVTVDVEEIRDLLKDEDILKIVHNAAFDVAWLEVKGFKVNAYTDTMIMSLVINNRVKAENSLGYLAKEYLNVELDKSLQETINWQNEVTEEHKNYCLKDAEVTFRLYRIFKRKIEELHLEGVLRREIAALPAVIEVNKNGMLFSYDGWSKELYVMENECNELLEKIREMLHIPDLNLQSPPQIINAFRIKGIELEGTSDEILAKYEEEIEEIHLIRKYKKLKKQITSFGEKIKNAMDEDGRLRGCWRLIGTDTSRMTCKEPNLQGMPGISKKYFHPAKGNKFIIADYSNIELRILAEITGDLELTKAFKNGEDLHIKTTRAVLDKSDDEEISSKDRKIGKIINFGLVYGMTSYGLRKKINAKEENNITLEEAETFRNRYFDIYKGVLKFQDKMLKSDFIETLGGRYWSKDTFQLKAGTISRFNYPIQASGAEGLKEALAILVQRKKESWKIVAVVHDEIVLEVPEKDKDIAADLLKKSMAEGMSRIVKNIPITVDLNIGDCWIKE